ncbi:YitT family protein [Actinokineospora soli]|uniref:YitT family protein n=1 Tax=Actinokineospora soli TaxID=1048753 RepID=A0ABW2TRH5_9PSEU
MSWRYGRLAVGLALFGASVALMLAAGLGVPSWDVLHQGIAERTGLPIGLVVNLVAVGVLLLWVPLRQRPGVGTVANVLAVGPVVDLTLAALLPGHWTAQVGYLLAGIALNGVAIGLYVGAGLGPGPRDGLMTGLAARGHPIRVVRTAIEVAVVAAGWLLGGTVGVGTALYAVAIGPLVHHLLPRLAVKDPACPRSK